MSTKKRVGIIGAGAVGGAFACALDRAGFDVTVTARGAHLDAINNDGLIMKGTWGEHTAHLQAVSHLETPSSDSEHFDFIMIAVKAQDMDAAIAENLSALQHADTIFLVQNGIHGLKELEHHFPKHRLAQGLAGLATSMLEPGKIFVTNLATTYIGNDADPDSARNIVDFLQDAMPVEFSENFEGALWTKLVVNCVNAFPAITNLSVQELVGTGLLKAMGISMQETVRVGLAHNVTFGDLMGISHLELAEFVDGDPNYLPNKLVEFMGPVPNLGSTLQSMRRQKTPEVDFLNGAVIAAGKEVQVATPMNEKIRELVWRAHREGFFTPEDALHHLESTV